MKIELNGVEKYYYRGRPNQVHALKQIGLGIRNNQAVCIHGPSGSGKSTLLSILGGIIGPTSGSAVVDGRRLSRLPDRFLTLFRRDHIGFIFQRFELVAELTVLDNVVLPLLPLGITVQEQKMRGLKLLKLLEIEHRSSFRTSEISGGELQRAAVARALINDPSIIIADEPTAHLDSRLSREFLTIMADLKGAGKTIIIASHDPLVSESSLIDRLLVLQDGRLQESG